jgi:hypothetical protein
MSDQVTVEIKTHQTLPKLVIATRLLLALVFVGAVLAKALSQGVDTGAASSHLPVWAKWIARPPFSSLVTALEAVVAVILLSRAWYIGLWLSVCIAAGSLGFLILLRASGVDPSTCGCFGDVRVGNSAHVLLLVGMAVCRGSVPSSAGHRVTVLASKVTAVCARARPFKLAPVFSTICV